MKAVKKESAASKFSGIVPERETLADDDSDSDSDSDKDEEMEDADAG